MPTTFRGGEIMGIRIPTVFSENSARRCAGCDEVIDDTPFRVTILDNVSTEVPPSWGARGAAINPGPYEFHADPDHFRAWCRANGYLFCRRSSVRDLMRPIAIPGTDARWGLCDGLHRDSHELVPA